MSSMSEKGLEEFLSQPILARIATVDKYGNPYIATMWFAYEDGAILMSTGKHSKKVENLKENPATAVSVDITEGGFKFKGAIFRGRAELIEEDVGGVSESIYRKYLGSLDHPLVKNLLKADRVIIKLKPEWKSTWDNTKERG